MVGAGVGLGAGVGEWVGGASVGAGAGWEVVPPAGCVPWVLPLVLVEVGVEVPAEGDGFPAADAPADGEALAAGKLAEDVPFPAVVCPADDCVEAEVLAPSCAADRAKSVVKPNAVTRLSSAARQVRRASRRKPASRCARRLWLPMADTSAELGLRAHQGCTSGLLSSAPGLTAGTSGRTATSARRAACHVDLPVLRLVPNISSRVTGCRPRLARIPAI